MQKVRLLLLTLTVSAAFAACSHADVVTEPLRKFGLGDLQKVAISPDRNWMVTCGSGGAFLWDFRTGTMLHRLEAHHSAVLSICLSPDGQVLLTGGGDAVIRAWQVSSGAELRSFAGHIGRILDLAFAPDGQSFVSVGNDTALVWSFSSGALLHSFTVPGAGINQARFAPDGRRLVTAHVLFTNLAESVRLWDLATEQTIRSFASGLVQKFEFVAGGHLVVAGADLTLQVWDIETGLMIRPLPGTTLAEIAVVGLLTASNNPTVTAGCLNGRVVTWDTSTGAIQNDFMGERLFDIAAIPGTNQFLTAHPDKLVRVKDRQIGTTLRTITGHTAGAVLGLDFSPDRRYVVSSGDESLTRLWNRTNAQQVRALEGHGAGTATARFSPDNTRILTTFGAPTFSARLWNSETGLLEREFFGHTNWLLAAVFSRDGLRIATGAQDGTARLWDVATGTQIRVFSSPGLFINAVAVSTNGMMLASGASDGIVRLWNTATGQLLRSFQFQFDVGAVRSLAFSPANGELLVGWDGGVLQTFDPATGQVKLDSLAPAGFLHDAVFSPDGRFILDAEGWPSFTARLWDARTGEELRAFAGHAGEVNSVAFNAAGSSILTGADIIRLWSIADIAARLESEQKPNGLELRWAFGTLQQSTDLTGQWIDVTNAVSPRIVPMNQSSAFFRTKADVE